MRLMWGVFWAVAAVLILAAFVVARTVYSQPAPLSSTQFFEATKAFLLCLGGAGVVLSTYFTAVNAFVQRRSEKINNTFDLLTSWDDPHLFQARKLTRKYKALRDEKSNNQLIEEIEGDEDLKNSVILVLNYFEHVRFSLKSNRIGELMFKESLGPAVIDIIDRFMPFAKKMSQRSFDDLDDLKNRLR
ncbi:DUF4760 domain-containing protein [Stenotrophomonas maltophilia]|uniref:DUF4760 domain-containing protein n=1 Tax=Stenotrophomonas maltophilia TaxID=40324 RepID=UPI00195538AC|nr:DUF4760 domain-containing protein [Stenotrophomonas maltophilia]